MTAAYLINRIPSLSLGWMSPMSKLQQALGVPDRDEYSHLKVFGYTTFALDKTVLIGEKMKARAKTGYLV